LETSRTMKDDLGIIGIMQEHLTVSCTSYSSHLPEYSL